MALRTSIKTMQERPVSREGLMKCVNTIKRKWDVKEGTTENNENSCVKFDPTQSNYKKPDGLNNDNDNSLLVKDKHSSKHPECHSAGLITPCSHLLASKLVNTSCTKDFLKPNNILHDGKRNINLSCSGGAGEMVGLILGVFTRKDDPYTTTKIYTKFAEELDNKVNHKISEVLDSTGPIPVRGESKVLYKIDPLYPVIAVVGIGDECASYNEQEEIDEMKENVRNAAALGARVLQKLKIKTILVDSMESAESAAEGSALGIWRFQELKSVRKQILIPRLELHGDCNYTAWQIGLQKAAAQNLARQLCETPANLLTPLGFAQASVEILSKAGVNVEVRGKDWAKIMEMGGFLAASKGSCESPVFMEVSYYGCEPDVQPVVLIGKGVTFDSGGLCIKHPCEALKYMRGDMAGAATVVAVIRAAAALHLPINIRGIMPLYENLPGSCAMKPGDIVRVKNGKSVLIHHTDHDGRLSLADALSYATEYNPKFIIDIGTLSRELMDSLGGAASATFSNNDSLFDSLKNAAVHTGDRVWRLPLWSHFSKKVTLNQAADVQDKAVESGLPCTCAAFLREFVPPVDWMHIDTFATAVSDGVTEQYLARGMSGRPTRTIIEFLAQLSCQTEDIDDSINESLKK